MNNSKIKIALQVILFAALGGAILYFLWQSLGKSYSEDCVLKGIPDGECSLFDKLLSDFKNAKFIWLAIISICLVISHLFRSVRWRLLLRSMGYEVSHFNAFACTLVGYFANLGIPRLGEFVRAGFIGKYESVAIEKAFATIVIERIVDLIMLAIMLLLGLIFHYENLWGYISGNINISGSTTILVLIIVVTGIVMGLYILRKILTLDEEGLHPIILKMKHLVEGFIQGIQEIRKLPEVGMFWMHSVGIWTMYFLMHYLAFFAFEPTSHLSWTEGILVFDFGSLGIVFPSPGGMGSYHFMIMEALNIFGVNSVDGFSFAMITFFTLTIFCSILLGLLSLILLPIVNHIK